MQRGQHGGRRQALQALSWAGGRTCQPARVVRAAIKQTGSLSDSKALLWQLPETKPFPLPSIQVVDPGCSPGWGDCVSPWDHLGTDRLVSGLRMEQHGVQAAVPTAPGALQNTVV